MLLTLQYVIKQKVNVKDFIPLTQEMNEAHLQNNIICKIKKKKTNPEHEQWKLACLKPGLGGCY